MSGYKTAIILVAMLALAACGQNGGTTGAPGAPGAPATGTNDGKSDNTGSSGSTGTASGSGLTGEARSQFVEGAVGTCSTKVAGDPSNASVPAATVTAYCTCYANKMADGITMEELQQLNTMMNSNPAQAQAQMQPRADAASAACRTQVMGH